MPATYIFRSIIFADTVNSCTAFGLAKVLDSYGDSFPISHYKDFSFERHEVVYIYIIKQSNGVNIQKVKQTSVQFQLWTAAVL